MRPASALVLIGLLGLLSCKRDQPTPPPAQYSVPSEVEPYVQRFRAETRQRGITTATDNLIITFGQTLGTDVCGQCLLEANQPPKITLNADAFCWKNASDNERECLIFHELGHCLLNRGHRTDRFPNHAYVSLMNPDDRAVYATCAYPIGGDVCDKRPRRGYYLDELVNPATPTPDWGK